MRSALAGKSIPKAATRADLVDAATRLNVFTRAQLEVAPAPKKTVSRRAGRTSWDRLTEGVVPRAAAPNDDEWVSNQELAARLQEHLTIAPPDKMGREALIAQCIRFRLLSEFAAKLPRPEYLNELQLRAMIVQAGGKALGNRARLLHKAIELGLITKCQATVPIVRPDKSEAARIAKASMEVVRCLGLRRMLRGVPGGIKAIDALNASCEMMTRIMFFGAERLQLHLRTALDKGLPLPDLTKAEYVRHIVGVGAINDKTKDAGMKAINEQFREVFAMSGELYKPKNMGNMYKHATNVLHGAITNHLANPDKVLQRIRKYASIRLFDMFRRRVKGMTDVLPDDLPIPDEPEVGDNPLVNIQNALLMEPSETVADLHRRQKEVIHEIREHLGLTGALTDTWLKSNMGASLIFTWKLSKLVDERREAVEDTIASILREHPGIEEALLRKHVVVPQHVALTPLCDDGKRFVTLDATDLAHILSICTPDDAGDDKEIKELKAADTVRRALRDNLRGMLGKQYVNDPCVVKTSGTTKFFWTGTMDTDGVSCNLHFRRAKRPDEQKKKKAKKEIAVQSKLPAPPKVIVAVDTGRVHLVKVAILIDGKVVFKVYGAKSKPRRKRPVTWGLSTRAYRSRSGLARHAKLTASRLRRDQVANKALHSELSASTAKTGCTAMAVRHMVARGKLAVMRWSKPTRTSANTRRRLRERKGRTLVMFWNGVRRDVERMTGVSGNDVALVWGVAVAATGRGNLPTPTCTNFKVAERVLGWGGAGWAIQKGSEDFTSANSCLPGHQPARAVRVKSRGVIVKRRLAPARLESQVRRDLVIGLRRKRQMRRGGVRWPIGTNVIHDRVRKWELDGDVGEDDDIKKKKKEARRLAGFTDSKYVRGLRVCQDEQSTKFLDRDVSGAINIGLLFIFDNVEGRQRPDAFRRDVRKTKSAAPVSGKRSVKS